MLSFLATTIAAAALVTFATSACTGLFLLAPERWRASFSAAARARALLGLCLAPLLTGALVMTAALAPSFGWIADHCLGVGDIHAQAHPHICEHHVDALPALSLLAFAAVLLARIIQRALGVGWTLARSALIGVRLKSTTAAYESAQGELRVLPLHEPQAFVLGYLRPTLFVTEGLLSPEHREHLAAVLAHEHAHIRRADPLRALIASAGLAFHLPWIASILHDRLVRAQEMAADADAASALGDRARIASALVHVARAQLHLPHAALAFGGSHVEQRVRGLLDERPLREWPSGRALWLGFAVACTFVALHADAVHHAVEQALGLLGGRG
jgi:Zn-dependent protease with chaperone function